MTRRKFFKKQSSKFLEDAVIVRTTIIEMIEKKKPYGDRYKNVFKCSSKKNPDGRMCVLWGAYNLDVGYEIEMKGRNIEQGDQDIFLAWGVQIIKTPGEEKADG